MIIIKLTAKPLKMGFVPELGCRGTTAQSDEKPLIGTDTPVQLESIFYNGLLLTRRRLL